LRFNFSKEIEAVVSLLSFTGDVSRHAVQYSDSIPGNNDYNTYRNLQTSTTMGVESRGGPRGWQLDVFKKKFFLFPKKFLLFSNFCCQIFWYPFLVIYTKMSKFF